MWFTKIQEKKIKFLGLAERKILNEKKKIQNK